jgi:hypothetical protein
VSFWSTGDREEEMPVAIRQDWEEVTLTLDRLAGHVGNVAAGDAEVVELAVGEAAQLGNRLPVAAPVTVIADQVHCLARLFVLVRSTL